MSLSWRLALVFAALLLAFAAAMAWLVQSATQRSAQESLQRLSHGLARHLVEHWPELASAQDEAAERAARDLLIGKLMVANPGIQVYLLDARGRVNAYLGEPGMVRQPQVDLAPLRSFLHGAELPLFGTDPMGGAEQRLFSVAPLPLGAGGYLYVVLDGPARTAVAGAVGLRRGTQLAIGLAAIGLALTLAVGVTSLWRLARPLRQLAARMRHYVGASAERPAADEVGDIADAFRQLTARIEAQAARERAQVLAQRETIAGLAHDLRTPLTALHGHIEALSLPERRDAHLRAALAQSDKLRRLTQQLFELATLQAGAHDLQRERFPLHELVSDTVQKFELASPSRPVQLQGPAPGPVWLDGDLQLVERALSNLIDNALRHTPGPVAVSLVREQGQAQVLVQDSGPGLPEDVAARLQAGAPLRTPARRSAGGGAGGLGLAIAQRVAELHGGSLRPLPAPGGGTRLCLSLPLAG